MLKQGEWRGSKLTGLAVYNNNDERVGEINELIIGKDGKIESVVLGVGGFLGIGEHDVAVPFGKVKFVEEPRRADRAAARTDERSRNEAAGARNDAAARMDANRTGPTNAPAASIPPKDRAPETTATTTRTASNDGYRGYPDHAVISMSKDQLKALPGVRYSR
jgi:sporulation protein YlmC with PRC-barrel domain